MPLPPAQLQQVVLGRARFEVNLDFNPELHSEGLTYEVQPEVGISDELVRNDDGLRAGVSLGARIVFTRTEEETREEGEQEGAAEELPVPFELEIQLLGVFVWSAEDMPDDDMGRAWLEYNGMYLMWPYLRSYIATITGMSSFPQLTIYTMNVPKPPVLDRDAESPESGETDGEPADADAPLAADE